MDIWIWIPLFDDDSSLNNTLSREAIETINRINIDKDDVDQNKACAICLLDYTMSEEVRELSCLHRFHEKCLFTWLESKRTCPVCREFLNYEEPFE